MARGGSKRNYVRDANGRFASTPGGGLAAARKAARSQSGRASTLSARTSLKKSRAKLAARDPADQRLSSTLSSRAQKAAVTRGNKGLKAAKVAARTRISGGRKGVIGKRKIVRPESPAKEPTKAASNFLSGSKKTPMQVRTRKNAAQSQKIKARKIIEGTRGTVVGYPAYYRPTAGGGQKISIKKFTIKQPTIFGTIDRTTSFQAKPVPQQKKAAPGSKSARRAAGIASRQKMSSEQIRRKTYNRVLGSRDLSNKVTPSITERRAAREGLIGSKERRARSEKTMWKAAKYLSTRSY